MTLEMRHGIPVVSLRLEHGDRAVPVNDVIVDTGSATTVVGTDILARLGIGLSPDDVLIPVRGVGGLEFVVEKRVDRLVLGGHTLHGVSLEAGMVGYGLGISAILGMDLLTRFGAVLDLRWMTLTFSEESAESAETA